MAQGGTKAEAENLLHSPLEFALMSLASGATEVRLRFILFYEQNDQSNILFEQV